MQLNKELIKAAEIELQRLKSNKLINRDRILHAETVLKDLKKTS